jgi:hypothetical protein
VSCHAADRRRARPRGASRKAPQENEDRAS